MILKFLRKFALSRRANVAVTFAIAALPLTAMAGMAIDIANATRVRLMLQDATDAAALGLARQAPTIADSAIASTARSFIASSYSDVSPFTVTNVALDRNTITATIDARADVPTNFAKLVGVSTIPVGAHAVAKGLLLEIAMVLDNSYSMTETAGSGGSKISALKTASTTFLDTMFGSNTTSQRVSISIVPFSASVNVGPTNNTAAWMDTTGASSLSEEDFSSGAETRWNLLSDMKVGWGGCVISRLPPYDIDDTTPTGSNPETLFTPWFAPDEPDSSGNYPNDYLVDNGGTCKNGLTTTQINNLNNESDAKKQSRICKYKNASVNTASTGVTQYGPNYFCDTPPITPLTNTRTTLNSAISAMEPQGNTNILEGLTWGWRALSPSAPFTQGKSYTAPNNRKVIILMTDGQNSIISENSINFSDYSAAGFISKGRYGTPTTNAATTTAWLDARTQLACTNAKAAGILIYSIAFGSGANMSQTLLKNCASDPKYFYAPQNSSDLKPVFLQIAQSINSLRIAE